MCGNQYPQKSILPGALCNCRCQCQPIISPHHTAEFKNFSSVMKFNRNKSFCQNPFMRKLVFYNISFFLFKDNTGSCSFSLKTCSNTNLLILSPISSPVYCERCKCEMRCLFCGLNLPNVSYQTHFIVNFPPQNVPFQMKMSPNFVDCK